MCEGTVTKPPARMRRSWEIQMRLDSGILIEFQVQSISLRCNIRANEQIKVSFYPLQQEGDLLKAKEVYSITRGKTIFRRR